MVLGLYEKIWLQKTVLAYQKAYQILCLYFANQNLSKSDMRSVPGYNNPIFLDETVAQSI